MTEIKWSKKEVVVRHHLDRYGYPTYPRFDVNVYRWKNYRLEKELYGENRLSYHIARDNLYLCDWHGSYHVSFFKTIKDATLALQNVLAYGLYGSQRWQDPNEKYIFGLLSYSPKRDVDVDFDEYLAESVDQILLKSKRKKPLLFWDGVDRKIKLNKSLK